MTYLEDAAAILNKELTAWNHRAIKNAENMRAEILDARLRIADGFARLASMEREPSDSAILPHELELRIADALSMVARYPVTDGGHHKTWIVDQVVRRLTGCLGDDGETAEYLRFREGKKGVWDEGIAP
jgi:hypothetical protein